jgi:hypothetical protein
MKIPNFKAALSFIKHGLLHPLDACTVEYNFQIPISNSKYFSEHFILLFEKENFNSLRDKIRNFANLPNYLQHSEFLETAINGSVVIKNDIHILLEGISESGLSTLANFIFIYIIQYSHSNKETILEEIHKVLLGQLKIK